MKRLWGIRHVRWYVLCYRFNCHVERMRSYGLGIVASEADRQYLDSVWNGEL